MKMINLNDYPVDDRAEIVKLAKDAAAYDGRFGYKRKQYIAKRMVYGGIAIYLFDPPKNKTTKAVDKKVEFSKEDERLFNEKVDEMIANNKSVFIFKNLLFTHYIKDGKLTFRGMPIPKGKY